MRTKCPDCEGDGKSRDPFWEKCFHCCGRGEYPEFARDVLPSDIGMGVGLAIKYTNDGSTRIAFILTGVQDERAIALAPPTGRLPSAWSLRAFAVAAITEWQAGTGEPLTLDRVRTLLASVTNPAQDTGDPAAIERRVRLVVLDETTPSPAEGSDPWEPRARPAQPLTPERQAARERSARATARARETVKPRDRITYARCGDTFGTFTFTHWNGTALCGRSTDDCPAISITKLNGKPISFGDPPAE